MIRFKNSLRTAACLILATLGPQDGKGQDVKWTTVVEGVRAAVVFVEVEYTLPSSRTADLLDRGTAFFISGHGQLLTAAHVVKERKGFDRKIKVYPTRGSSNFYVASIVAQLPNLDASVLQIVPEATRTHLELGDSQGISDGQVLYFMGFPTGSWASGPGAVTNTSHGGLWRFGASTGTGGSGGPIIDECGRAVGLIMQGGEGTTEAIPSARLLPLALGFLPRKALQPCRGTSVAPPTPPVTSSEQQMELRQLLDAAIAQLFHHPVVRVANRAITSGIPLDYRSNRIIRHPEQSKHMPSRLSDGDRAAVLERYQQITSEIISKNLSRDNSAAALERAKQGIK